MPSSLPSPFLQCDSSTSTTCGSFQEESPPCQGLVLSLPKDLGTPPQLTWPSLKIAHVLIYTPPDLQRLVSKEDIFFIFNAWHHSWNMEGALNILTQLNLIKFQLFKHWDCKNWDWIFLLIQSSFMGKEISASAMYSTFFSKFCLLWLWLALGREKERQRERRQNSAFVIFRLIISWILVFISFSVTHMLAHINIWTNIWGY